MSSSRDNEHPAKAGDYKTLPDTVAALIASAKRILVVAGAGISVSCGIPDFRSENGLYALLRKRGLDDPSAVFDIAEFRDDPRLFYDVAAEFYPRDLKPSTTHFFLRALERGCMLRRVYTQNIDGLELQAGIKNTVQCHGSFTTARCLRCRSCVEINEIEQQVLAKVRLHLQIEAFQSPSSASLSHDFI